METVARFCIAKNFDQKKVVSMWKAAVEWYEDYRPDLIDPTEELIRKNHVSKKYRYVGFDKEGCPVLLVRIKHHVKGLATIGEGFRYLVYMIEEGLRLARKASNCFHLT